MLDGNFLIIFCERAKFSQHFRKVSPNFSQTFVAIHWTHQTFLYPGYLHQASRQAAAVLSRARLAREEAEVGSFGGLSEGQSTLPKTNLDGGFKYFYFHPYLGKISILTNIFQMG